MNMPSRAGQAPPAAGPSDTATSLPGSRRLRIALTLPPWFDVPPRAYGGIEALMADLADALIALGHDVVIVGAGVNGTRARFLRTYETPPSARLGEALPEVLQAAWADRYLDDLEVDIVHDNSLAGPLTARGRAAPTVLTAHGPCEGEMVRYYRALCSDVHMVAISQAQQRLARDLNWAGTVHNAIRVADFPYRVRKNDYVLFLGRFNRTKGAHLAIDAARRAGRPILLAGKLQETEEREYFDAEVRPRLGPDAQFVGEVDMAAKQELYAGAHCLVFPIQWEEPFGLVMIEAMACGSPVVALRRGSVPEIVVQGVTGFVRDDPAELPAAIDQAGGLDPAACRRHVARHFDVSIMARGYERVYARIIGDRAGRSAPTPGPRDWASDLHAAL
ncbi:MAG: sle [Streptosporangiaceae bacterium]|nr:sle [Streptosporangiaceae bacterium]